MRIADMIRQRASMSGLPLREYEALILYEMDTMRMTLTFGGAGLEEGASDRVVLREFAARVGAGSCGETANQLAEILLGRDLGRALAQAATRSAFQGSDGYAEENLGGLRSCSGRGLDALRTALEGTFRNDHALFVISIKGVHRFLVIKQEDAVEVLQAWFDGNRGVGYTLADWLAAGNDRVTHTVDEFVTRLEAALNGDADRAREMFQPVGGPSLPPDNFELQGREIGFAAVLLDMAAMSERFTGHHQQQLTGLG